MTVSAFLADRVLNRPLLITPEKAQVVLSVLGSRIGVDAPMADRFEGDSFIREDESGERGKVLPYKRTPDGVAIISIVGSLVNRGAYVGASSGLVSYEGVKHQLKHAENDEDVRVVLLDIQSPGGEAIGAFEAAERVRHLASKKRTIALVNGMAASAAYAIASGASEIVTTETGVSGSIGVVLLHADFSKNLSDNGIDPTLIFAGSRKVDGNPFEPLSENVHASLQSEVDALYSSFLTTGAKGRGDRLTADMARATEARTFIGQAAVDAGIADRLGTFESVLSELLSVQGGRISVQQRRTSMDNKNGATAAEATAGISQADHDAAVATATATGIETGAKATQDRFKAIFSAEGISGNASRMGHALDLACEAPNMGAEKVVSMTTKHVAEKPDGSAASLKNRAGDTDPLGEHSGASSEAAPSGLSSLINNHVAQSTK